MKPRERIPLHDHVDNNSGGPLDRGSVMVAGGGSTGGSSGGTGLAVHVVEGPYHTTAETDTTKRLAPDGLGGVTWAVATAGSGMVPTYLNPAEIFVVPANRQALFSLPIVLDVGAGISIGTNAALVEVH